MKIIPFVLLLFSFSCLQAQYVNIPDSVFRSRMQLFYPGCFNDQGLMDTTCTSITNLSELDCGDWQINSLDGIQYFKSLTYLDCINNELSFLPRLPSKLTYLNCHNNKLSGLPALPESLQFLDCFDNPLLLCLPKLPVSLTRLYIDTGTIKCLPNEVPGLLVILPGEIPVTVPLCNGPANTNGCSFYKDNIWTGTISNAWEDPANWSSGTIPDENTDVIINSGTVTVNSDIKVRSLRVNPNAVFSVSTGFTLTIKQ